MLDSIAAVRRLVSFYVREHNEVMPHWAFKGLTPDEVYLGKTDGVVEFEMVCNAAGMRLSLSFEPAPKWTLRWERMKPARVVQVGGAAAPS